MQIKTSEIFKISEVFIVEHIYLFHNSTVVQKIDRVLVFAVFPHE